MSNCALYLLCCHNARSANSVTKQLENNPTQTTITSWSSYSNSMIFKYAKNQSRLNLFL